ncbi:MULTISPECIES: hypothetical protein [Enterobacteriaceae]|uniref:hypothetical protein n=1 Tax=Enterobacteriaceae TaxID=543 RepID=UPI000735BA16|nr:MULTISPECIES: hypothetical protein [Enterobacteriaceae]EBO4153022.1 hypothetical protein [Salmonella enterica]EHF5057955.1 hypothetical protein [Enterobacter hormaechei]EIW8641428.1 hypothetical protein [Klebsiella pneumoniae]KTI66503.1 hypothetical protein ASV01_25275 [Enterobacter kobei]MCQ0910668.1 hypothetical protein [Klebsiella pneumoniae]
MAKFKSLIVGAKFEVASRKTTCKHDKKHVITKGEFRLSVKNPTQGESYYCLSCAKTMVTESLAKLEGFKSELDSLSL